METKQENKTLKVENFKILEDGLHKGKIVGIEWRDVPFEYMDVVIETDEQIKVKVGYPQKVFPTNKTGTLLTKFGANLEIGSDCDPVKILVGKRCAFVSIQKITSKGTFANVNPESVRPC